MRDSRILAGMDEPGLNGDSPGPGPGLKKNSHPGTRPGPKVESHPGAGPGAGQRFQPHVGPWTQISVPRRPLVCDTLRCLMNKQQMLLLSH